MLYQGGDIYLIDDFFDELAEQIKLELFRDVILEYLNDKTVIYVSLEKELLSRSDKVLVMLNQKMDAFGSFSDLLKT